MASKQETKPKTPIHIAKFEEMVTPSDTKMKDRKKAEKKPKKKKLKLKLKDQNEPINKGSKGRKKAEVEEEEEDFDEAKDEEEVSASVVSLRVRTTPNQLFKVLAFLNQEQKQAIIDMGLGSLLSLKINELSGRLAYFVNQNLDVQKMELKVGDDQISIDRELVHYIMGIPMGNIDLLSMTAGVNESENVALKRRWKAQFGGKFVRASSLCTVISRSPDIGELFKVNFLMLFATTMINCDRAGKTIVGCLNAIVNCISQGVDIKEIDWCGFVLHHLKKCKSSDKKPYNGPMTFLEILYVDSTMLDTFPVSRGRPAINFWTEANFSRRIKMELEEKSIFGELPLLPAFSDSAQEVGFVVSSSGVAADTTSHPSVEEFHATLESLKIEMGKTLMNALSINPENVKLLDYQHKFDKFCKVPDDKKDEKEDEKEKEDECNLEDSNQPITISYSEDSDDDHLPISTCLRKSSHTASTIASQTSNSSKRKLPSSHEEENSQKKVIRSKVDTALDPLTKSLDMNTDSQPMNGREEYVIDIPDEFQMEARISRLERIVARLKAAKAARALEKRASC